MLIDAITAHQLSTVASEGVHYNIMEASEAVISRAVNEQIMLSVTKGNMTAYIPNPRLKGLIRRLEWCGYDVREQAPGYFIVSFVKERISHEPYWKDPEIMPADAAFLYAKMRRQSTGPTIDAYLWGERLKIAVENKIVMMSAAGRFRYIVQADLDDDIKWELQENGFQVSVTDDRYLKRDGYPRRRDKISW